MENKKKGKKKISIAKVVSLVLLAVCTIVFVAGQIYLAGTESSISTEIALSDSAYKSVSVQMLAIRDEKILEINGKNMVSAVSDGSRVSYSDVVAYSFSDSTSAGNLVKMAEIEELLDYYNGLSNKSATMAGNTDAYDNRIFNDLGSFSEMVASGDFSDLTQQQANMRDAITSKQTATGVKLDVSETIAELNQEYNRLQESTGSYTPIYPGGTGYYISGTDGYENILKYSDMEKWTIDDVSAAFEAQPEAVNPNDIGRLVHGYYWYLVCITDTSSINQIKEGSRKTITFPDTTVQDISAYVESIRNEPSGKSMIVFSCNLMNEDLASLRFENAQIVLDNYEGYRVDNRAIRVNEANEKGVYVVSGGVMKFKKINIVYSADDYSIVTNPFKDDVAKRGEYINLYDEYIIEGMDLSDGKLIE